MTRPVRENEVHGWVNEQVYTLASKVLVKEQTPEFWERVRKDITNAYYRTKPTGLVMIQSIITDEINLYNEPKRKTL